MDVFIDSNVLLSGIVFRGPENKFVFTAPYFDVRIFTSEDVVEKTRNVLKRKFPASHLAFEDFLKKAEIEVIPKTTYELAIFSYEVRDQKDRHVLAAAVAAGCDALVTGDKDLLELERIEKMRILTTRTFLKERGAKS